MQRCPFCGCVYDESESAGCPNCNSYDDRPISYIVFDKKQGKAVELSEKEYEEFKKDNPDYQ